MNEEYIKHLISAVQNLLKAEQILFTTALNVAWFGELSHLKDSYDTDDIVPFNLALLKSVSDPNVKKIISFLEPLMQTAESIKNLNKITDEEVGWSTDNQ